jgi:hypothetical protein
VRYHHHSSEYERATANSPEVWQLDYSVSSTDNFGIGRIAPVPSNKIKTGCRNTEVYAGGRPVRSISIIYSAAVNCARRMFYPLICEHKLLLDD